MRKRGKDLTEGNIKKQLFNLTWPMLFGMMGMVIFNLVDTFFVGQLGVRQLAAMSFGFPIIMFINSLSQGIGIGTSSLISRNIIASSRHNVKMMASRALLLGFLVVLVFVITGLFTIKPVFSALGAQEDTLKYISDYMGIWYLGVPFVVFPMIGNHIVRATGDTFTPGMIMVASAALNIILDPLLIFGIGPFPEMGIRGAALATVIARSSSFTVILIILIRRENLLTIQIGRIKEIFKTWGNVVHIAAPASLGMLITPISIGIITRIIADYGKEAVAAFGVASRVEMFALMVIASLGSVMIIFIGQNISKRKFRRIHKSLKYAFTFSISWGVVMYLILIFFGRVIGGIFSDDTQVVDIAKSYFIIVGASYGFMGFVMLSNSCFNGINKPYPATVLAIIRMLVLYVPLAILGSALFNLTGVFLAGLIANVAVGILSIWYLRMTLKKMELNI